MVRFPWLPLICAAPFGFGCSSDSDSQFLISLLWTSEAQEGDLAPPAAGSDDRVIIAGATNGFLGTLDGRNGRSFDPIQTARATVFPPLEVGGAVYVVSLGGQIERHTFDGNPSTSVQGALNQTTSLLPLPDGFAIGTTSGMVLRFDGAGTLQFQRAVNGSVVGQLGADDMARVYAYTDLGILLRVTSEGTEPLGSVGPSPGIDLAVSLDRIAVAGGEMVEVRDLQGEVSGMTSVPEVKGVTASGEVGLAWSDAVLLGFLMSSGSTLYSLALESPLVGKPVFVKGRVTFVTQSGSLVTLAPNGEITAQTTVPIPVEQPVVDRADRILLARQDRVGAYDLTLEVE